MDIRNPISWLRDIKNPISWLRDIMGPVEFASITLPSAALVVLLFTYRGEIHPDLLNLPDLLSDDPFGAVIFIVSTLIVSLLIKYPSHTVLNKVYDKTYRNFWRRKEADTFYRQALDQGKLTSDPKKSQYYEAYKQLEKQEEKGLFRVDLLQIQSKFARSITVIALCMSVIMGIWVNWLLFIVCLLITFVMLFTFFKFRWDASEFVYEMICEDRGT